MFLRGFINIVNPLGEHDCVNCYEATNGVRSYLSGYGIRHVLNSGLGGKNERT